MPFNIHSMIARLRSPLAGRIGWTFAVLSAIAAAVMIVQEIYGGPLWTTIPIGPASKIEPYRAETGCYRWRPPAKFRSPTFDYRAVVLEDGVPLSHVEHIADATDVKASHYHVRNAVIHFATGDASDVRTNGHRYELRVPVNVRLSTLLKTLGVLTIFLGLALNTGAQPWIRRATSLAGRTPAWTVFLASLLLATGDLVLQPDRSQGAMLVKGLPESDAVGWRQLSERLAEGRGLDDVFGAQRPFYGVLIGACMSMLGERLLVPKAVNALMIALAAAGVFSLGRAMRFPWAGLGAAVFLTLAEDHVAQLHMVTTEQPGLAYGVLASCAFVWALARRSPLGCALAGALAAIGNLTCGELILAMVLNSIAIAGLAIVWKLRAKEGIRLAASFILGASVVMLPWMSLQKARYGIFTLSMNSAELLSGGADPVHGKLNRAMHIEAAEKGFDTSNLVQRYHYFKDRFARDVKTDPAGYIRRVGSATIESLSFVRTDDPIVRVLLALAVLGIGVQCTVRHRGIQPFVLSTLVIVAMFGEEASWPVWWITAPVVALLFRRWRGHQLLALIVVLTTVSACAILCGLAGNVASRRFWLLADWALVLLWLQGLAATFEVLTRACARIPLLGLGLCRSRDGDMQNAIWRGLCFSHASALSLIAVSMLALVIVLIQQARGPRPMFDENAIAALQQAARSTAGEVRFVYFDDDALKLGQWEQVSHWAPYYLPTEIPRWIARPRLIQDDGTLGTRITIEAALSQFPDPPRWRAMKCSGTRRELIDRISQRAVPVLQLQALEPLEPAMVRR